MGLVVYSGAKSVWCLYVMAFVLDINNIRSERVFRVYQGQHGADGGRGEVGNVGVKVRKSYKVHSPTPLLLSS